MIQEKLVFGSRSSASGIPKHKGKGWGLGGGKGKWIKMLTRLPSGWSRMARRGEVEEGIPLKGVAKHHSRKPKYANGNCHKTGAFLEEYAYYYPTLP